MSRKVRMIGAIAAATAMAAGLAACGGGGSGAEPVGSLDSNEKATITFWTWQPTTGQWRDIYAKWKQTHPNVTIKATITANNDDYQQQLRTGLAAGEGGPDVFGVQSGSMISAYSQFAEPVTDESFPGWSSLKGDLNAKSVKQTQSSDGNQVGVPVITSGQEYLLYNKTLLNENGIAEPPSTYAELVSDVQKLKSKGVSAPLAFGGKDGWHVNDFFIALSQQWAPGKVSQVEQGKAKWTDPALVQTGNAWKKLFTDGVFQKGATGLTTYPDARDTYFYARKSAFFPTGSWHVSITIPNAETKGTKIEKDDVGMVLFPQVGPKPAVATTGVDFALAVNRQSKNKAAVNEFIKFMTQGAGQQLWVNTLQGSPVNKNVQAQLPENASKTARQSVALVTKDNAASQQNRKLTNADVDTALGQALQEIGTGQKSVEAALAEVQQAQDSAGE